MPCHDSYFVNLYAASSEYSSTCDTGSVTTESPCAYVILQGLSHSSTEGFERVHHLDFVRMTAAFCGEEGRAGCVGEVSACREPCPMRSREVVGAEEVLQRT